MQLCLRNVHNKCGAFIDVVNQNGSIDYAFLCHVLNINRDIMNQPKNQHKMFKQLWLKTKCQPFKYLKPSHIKVNGSRSLNGGGMRKEFLDNYR